MGIKITKIIAFCLTFILLFFVAQAVFTPDHNMDGLPWYMINSFGNFEKNSIDVLFLGASRVMEGYSPLKIYEDTKIRSYDLGTSGQPIGLSYNLLKMALESQSPKVVILDPNSLFKDVYQGHVSWRYVLDNMPLSKFKVTMAADYSSQPDSDGFLSAVFPLLRFHDRWNDLLPKDFARRSVDHYYSAGEYVVSAATPNFNMQNDVDEMEAVIEGRSTAPVKYYRSDSIGEYMVEDPIIQYSISEEYMEYLRQMMMLCDSVGAELVLMPTPCRTLPLVVWGAWTKGRSDMVRTVADEMGLRFIDLVYDVDVGIDFTTDSNDGGNHLNLRGAEKLSNYIENFLTENYQLSQSEDPEWNEMLEKYRKVREVAYTQMETDFHEYLKRLIRNKDKYAILIAADDEYTSGLGPEDLELFGQLGLQLIQEGEFADAYLAVLQNGELEYEAVSHRKLTYDTAMTNGTPVSIVSSGWYTGSVASIVINGAECSMNQPGLNIVVWDEETGLIVDVASVNTRSPNASVAHAGVWDNLRAYESVVALDGVGF